MKIYTKYGDTGYTRIVGGKRLLKDDLRVESYGTIDELCSFIGQTLLLIPDEWEMKNELAHIQQVVFSCGSDLAVADFYRPFKVVSSDVEALEKSIDVYIGKTPKITKFIMPGGCQLGAQLHVLRSITRRAERRIVSLQKMTEDGNPLVLQYVNRLSDYFFMAARMANHRLGVDEVFYEQSTAIFKDRK